MGFRAEEFIFVGDINIESAAPIIYFKDSDGTTNNYGATYFDDDTMYVYTRDGSSHGKIVLTSYNGTSQVDRLILDTNGVRWGGDTQSGSYINYRVQNNLSTAGSATKTITFTALTQGFCKIRISMSDGNAQYAHFVAELGGTMYASSNGYNATVVSNSASSMSISVTKNNASYVVAITSGSNYGYGAMELTGGSYTGGSRVSYAFS